MGIQLGAGGGLFWAALLPLLPAFLISLCTLLSLSLFFLPRACCGLGSEHLSLGGHNALDPFPELQH